jgi:hypothetical protein
MEEMVDRPRQALVQKLEEALIERGVAQERFDAAIGTSAEMGAYLRLRGAARRLAAADRAARGSSAEWRGFSHA